MYASLVVFISLVLILHTAPVHGNSNVLVYVSICSLAGSLSVMSVKALGIAVKLTLAGNNQMVFIETYYCIAVVATCVMTQISYLNRALDVFNTAVVSPIYYVFFTTLTIMASAIMMKDWRQQAVTEILFEVGGFATIISGIYLLYSTKDYDPSQVVANGHPLKPPR